MAPDNDEDCDDAPSDNDQIDDPKYSAEIAYSSCWIMIFKTLRNILDMITVQMGEAAEIILASAESWTNDGG